MPVSIVLAIASSIWLRSTPGNPNQAKLSLAVWIFSAIVAGILIVKEYLFGRMQQRVTWQINSAVVGKVVLCGGVFLLIAQGLFTEIKGLSPKPPPNPPDVDAGLWLRSHTEENSIVMATDVPTVFHYSQRKLVWSPPISNPQVLMDGIRKHKVNYVVEVYRTNPYYLPPDQDCLGKLVATYPDAFQLVSQGSKFNIFRVVTKPGTTLQP
jgi:hypothetical protein